MRLKVLGGGALRKGRSYNKRGGAIDDVGLSMGAVLKDKSIQ